MRERSDSPPALRSESEPSLQIAPAQFDDLEAVRGLNEAAIPHVGSLSRRELEHLHHQSRGLLVVRDARGSADPAIAAFVLLLDQDADYTSPNFLWFQKRHPRFLYVDRIVVDAGYRRRGLATRLYRAACDLGSGEFDVLACEVNSDPPNPTSMSFHRGFGFLEVGEQRANGKDVVMFECRLPRIGDAADRSTPGPRSSG